MIPPSASYTESKTNPAVTKRTHSPSFATRPGTASVSAINIANHAVSGMRAWAGSVETSTHIEASTAAWRASMAVGGDGKAALHGNAKAAAD